MFVCEEGQLEKKKQAARCSGDAHSHTHTLRFVVPLPVCLT